MLDFPPFPGFRDEAFAFLRALKENNDRDWFKPRKATFDDELQWPMRCLLVDTARRLAEEGIPLLADPKKSIFRIYRDTRFSKNKDPYKTHVGGVLSRTGTAKEHGGVYVHVEPDASFFGAGFYHPDKTLVAAWREHMVNTPATFLDMVSQLDKRGLELNTTDDSLKRMPRGFEEYADSDVADYLRWKSYLVGKPIADEALQASDFTEAVVQFTKDVLPFLEYGWERMDSITMPA